MAGHSKWANIRHRKGAQDARRAKVFTKLLKEISVAARTEGGDPDSNPRLRLAIQNAKGVNIPKEIIERAIKKATGDDASDYLEVAYEGYAPNGVAVFIECATDNINRTVSSVRAAFSKGGGNLATNGSVEFLFERKGVFYFSLPPHMDMETLELAMIEAGAESIETQDEHIRVIAAMEDFGSVQKKLDEVAIEVEEANLQRIPLNLVSLDDKQFVQSMWLIERLEDDDDVQKVYHNLKVSEDQVHLV
ncbi:MAG: YebC/PmpR family DNA-binding transcriptional regulator [Bacteroidia bacterium]|nr:YebC/PmpR family DNA-binding transcriptional regulator [Bacteroidia bacterium]